MAALSKTTGVSVATLKFYVREGLLHAGTATAPNQAEYDESHVRRVRLVRALTELGRLSLADVRDVLVAVDDDSLAVHDAFGVTQDAMVPTPTHGHRPSDHHDDHDDLDDEDPLHAATMAEVDRFVRRHRLQVRPDARVRSMLAEALISLGRFGWAAEGSVVDSAIFDPMVPVLREQAEFEMSTVPGDVPRSEQVEYTVVGTVVFEVAAAAIRRMALEHESARRFGTAGTPKRRAGRAATADG